MFRNAPHDRKLDPWTSVVLLARAVHGGIGR
jgi:hypothetical protein